MSDIIQNSEIALNMAKRDISVKYKRSWFGVLWSLLNPFVLVLVYTFAFKIVLRSPIENFSIFLLIGIAPWTLFSGIVSGSANAIIANSNLISKIYFKRTVLIYSNVLFNLFFYLMTLVIIAVFVINLKLGFSVSTLLSIFCATLLLVVFASGIGFFVSALSVRFRDIPHLIEVSLLALFWVSPIVYDSSSVPKDLNLFTEINPIACVVGILRNGLLGSEMPENIWVSVVISVSVYCLGLVFFKSKEKYFAEYL